MKIIVKLSVIAPLTLRGWKRRGVRGSNNDKMDIYNLELGNTVVVVAVRH